MPKISVIMSVYKEPIEWIKQSIDSILNQTFSDFEIIIVNDKPDRKENKDILDKYIQKEPRIKVITNESNQGLTKSLNKAICVASGEYIARMDADDIADRERFKKQVAFMDKNKDIGVCGGWLNFFGDKTGTLQYPENNTDMCLFLDSPFAHPAVMIRKKIMDKFDLKYDERYRVSQDYDLWVRMFSNGVKFYNLQEVILNYRYSNIQIMKSHGELQIKISKEIRHRALETYYDSIGKIYKRPKEWTLESMNEVLSLFGDRMNKEQMTRFWFYSFLSFTNNIFLFTYDLIRANAWKNISCINLARLFYFRLRGSNLSKF